MTRKIDVSVPSEPISGYSITIGSGLLDTIAAEIKNNFPGKNLFLVTDSNLDRAGHINTFAANTYIPRYIIDPPGEQSKHIQTVINIVENMEKAFLGRDTVVIALGGGTVGDIAGFVAGIFKRGTPVVHIPTTTVSQADSSVGGKTGVDSTLSKNAFGIFHQPSAVYIDVKTLQTLDDREFRSGLVESVKHALVWDREYFEFIETRIDDLIARKNDVLEELAFRNCTIKAAVVQADPKEKNLRRVLNYGHTIGHAVESASNYTLLHGEAVAIGIIGASLIENQMSLGNEKRTERIKNVLSRLNVPLKIPSGIEVDQLVEIIKRDKKSVAGWPKFILLEEIGRVSKTGDQWVREVDKETTINTLKKLY